MLEVRLFGTPRARELAGGDLVAPQSGGAQRLLAILALEHQGAPLPRPDLTRKLWRDGADGSLRTALTELRAAFRDAELDPNDYLEITEGRRDRVGTIQLCNVGNVDALDFEGAAASRDSERMLELAPATFLAGLANPGPHLTRVRERYARLEADACAEMAKRHWEAGRSEAAIALAERRCELAPSDARAALTLMGYLRERGELERASAHGREFVRAARARGNPTGGVPEALEQLAGDDGHRDPAALNPGSPPPGPAERMWPAPLRQVGRAAAGGLAIVGALVVAAILLTGADSEGGSGGGGELALTDCNPFRLTEPSRADLEATEIPTPPDAEPGPTKKIVARSLPRAVDVGSDAVWLAQSTDGSIWRIDPRIDRPVGQPYPVQGIPYTVEVAADAVWVTRDDGHLVQLDRDTGEIVRAVRIGPTSAEIALGGGFVWSNIYDGHNRGSVARIDPCSGDVEYIDAGTSANTVIYAFGALWVSDSSERAIHRIDPETGEVSSVALDVGDPQDLGAASGEILVAHYGPKRLTRIDPEQLERVGKPIEIGAGAAGIDVGAGAIWVPNYEGDSVTRIDLETFESDPEFAKTGDSPTDLAVGHGRLWVSDNDSEPPTVTAIVP